MTVPLWPSLNAILNATSAALLLTGWRLIRSGRRQAHRRAMIGAFVTSSLFLASYLAYHARVGSVRFLGQGIVRPLYFTLLLSHTVLAALIVPLVLVTLNRGLRGRFEAHRPLARVTAPLWIWVSLSGVAVYGMLYWL